jgi:hypothetical protein
VAQANGVDELARQRALATERQRRRRARLKVVPDGAASPGGAVGDGASRPAARGNTTGTGTDLQSVPVRTGLRVHDTQRLESLGSAPTDFVGVPPATDAPAELVAPPSADAIMGAKKFAALIGFMVKMSLDDASVRYGANLAAMPGGALLGDNPEALKLAAVDFVTARAERCALKYGFGLNIPYEDEVVTLGAAAGSGVYLLRKFTGRLPDPSNPKSARTEATAAPPSPDGAEDADQQDPAYGRVNLDVANAEPLPSWMAGR